MKKRLLFVGILILATLLPRVLSAQGTDGNDAVLGLPVIECSLVPSDDKLFFVGNDYLPNTITVTATVTNISPDTAIARDLRANMVADTRFNIDGNPIQWMADSLLPGESVSVDFILNVAAARAADGIDVITCVFISSNAYSKACQADIWVEHEYVPALSPTCNAEFVEIVFDDNINDYSPNPFTIRVDVLNDNLPFPDGASDSTLVQFIGVRGVSLYPQDTPIKFLDVLNGGEMKSASFQLVPTRRTNDTTISICFEVRGIGGYLRKNYLETCCIDVFIPKAKEAAYDLVCDIVPDFIEYKDHKYNPDPFEFTVDITNIGTAIGKNVKARLIMPPGIILAAGETQEKSLGDMPTGPPPTTVSWMLKPTPQFDIVTKTIRVRVYDQFNNQAICSDSVIIDSIRAALFNVTCICPDSLIADTLQGIYLNNPFEVEFIVCNVGSDYADSLEATIIIGSPEVTLIAGETPVKKKWMESPDGTDTLGVDSCFTFRWTLEAMPRANSGPVVITFKSKALNALSKECQCTIYIPKIDAPTLDTWCITIPDSTLLVNPVTGGYFPNRILYRVYATNIGGGIAQNIQVTLALPPGVVLDDDGSGLRKNLPDLVPRDTAYAEWLAIPVERYNSGMNAVFTTEITAENIVERMIDQCDVYIPRLPTTAALAIPRNNVGYTNSTILVPMYIDDPDGKDITEFELELRYNVNNLGGRKSDDIVRYMGLIADNALASGWEVLRDVRNASNDQLNIHIRGNNVLAYPPPGEPIPPLLWLRFEGVYGNSPNQLDIEWSNVLWPGITEIEDKIIIIGGGGNLFPRVTDGLITVSGDCLRPLTASPDYSVAQNRPNPFNPVTTIDYSLPVDEHVRISVFDALGRSVKVLVDDDKTAGSHSVRFSSDGLHSGVYFYRMETPHFSKMMKMVIAK